MALYKDGIFGGCVVCFMGYLIDGLFGGWEMGINFLLKGTQSVPQLEVLSAMWLVSRMPDRLLEVLQVKYRRRWTFSKCY